MTDVWQLVAGSVAVHSVDPPEANVTVPVAVPGSPATDSVSCAPYAMLAGAADSVNVELAFTTVKLAPVAVDPL